MSKTRRDSIEAANAAVLAELVVDPMTSEHTRVTILNMLLQQASDKDFFRTMFKEDLSFGACPECQHENHWLIPEDTLNQMGYVSSTSDPRVKRLTTPKDCEQFQEACSKKKVVW